MNFIRFVFVSLLITFCLLTHAADPESILIRNVTLIDRVGSADDVVVSLLIKDGKLDLVTEERIPRSEAETVIEAENRVLLGRLSLAEAPSFVILDDDPRTNFQVIRDTAAFVKLTVEEGVVLTNTIPVGLATEPEPESKPAWLAYNPPPFALPVSYYDNRKFNRFETGPISGLFNGAVMLDRMRWLDQDDGSLGQFGDLSEFDGGVIRGLRFAVVGTLNFDTPWVYTIAGATFAFDKGFESPVDEDVGWFDYRLDIPLFDRATLSVGKQKEPISMERMTGMVFLPMQERTIAADAMLPSRNHGIVLNGTGFDERMSWAGGVFNNWIDSGESFSDTPTQYVGRVTGLPWTSEDQSNLLHLGFGVRRTNAKLGLQYKSKPEFSESPLFVDTSLFPANSSTLYDAEVSWRKGPAWLSFEFLYNDVDSPEFGDPTFKGYNLTASWILTGEMRDYNHSNGTFRAVPVSRSVYQGGWGAWEVAARWSELDLTDGLIDGGETEIFSLGINWWLTPTFQAGVNWRTIALDQSGVSGRSNGAVARILLIFE